MSDKIETEQDRINQEIELQARRAKVNPDLKQNHPEPTKEKAQEEKKEVV